MLPNRDMAAQFVYTQLSIGGFGFIPNLTQADASFIFPVALGLLNLAIVEVVPVVTTDLSHKIKMH